MDYLRYDDRPPLQYCNTPPFMIAYIKGNIAFKSPTYVIVEANGIGYHINISLNTYAKIEKLEKVKLFTYFHVKEDMQSLYGFDDNKERKLFVYLISVTGIGPNTARVMLSAMTPDELRAAIVSENVAAFKKVRGVGPKTAKRLILDLKDKIIKDSGEDGITIAPVNNTFRREALSALVALGYKKIQAQKALNRTIKEHPDAKDVETLIKRAFKYLM